jgi:cytochrome c oxidase subunit II
MGQAAMGVRLTVLGIVAAAGLAGCGGQSTLSPHSHQAHEIRTLWWWLLAVASVVFLGAVAMLVVGWVRRTREGLPLLGQAEKATTSLVVLFGMVIPIVVLTLVFVFSDLVVARDTDSPAAGATRMTVRVVGHQWWWEARYPGTPVVTANEIHIPVGVPVRVVGTSADVIHSFWVPELNRKIDFEPGYQNSLLLQADRPGRFRGQCAEFCGLQHAHMSFWIDADPPARFQAWLRDQGKPATAATGVAGEGEREFMAEGCASCHQIRGTAAQGTVGPDLTHVASRSSLASLTIPNDAAHLRAWIADPQHVKPGNKMPGLNISTDDIDRLVAYLRSLR